MIFPNINYKFNDLEEAKALTSLIEQKLTSVEKYLHDKQSGTCDIEFEKVAPHKNGQIHRVEINLLIEGTLFRAEATEESFEKAIDEVRGELDKEMRRAKEKQSTLVNQSGREAKEQMLNDD